MGITEARFNAVAKAMGLGVRWTDRNNDGERTDDELRTRGRGDARAEAALVDRRIARLDSFAKDFKGRGIPQLTTSRHPQVIGNPIIFDEVKRLVEAHGNSTEAIDPVTPVDSLKAPTETRLIGGVNLDDDGHPDFVIIQSFETYVAPSEADRHETTSFLAAIQGTELSDKKGAPSKDMIKSAKLLKIASYPGSSHPINGLKVTDTNGDGIQEVRYRAFDPEKQEFIYRTASLTTEDVPSTKAIFDTLFGINAYYSNTLGYFDVMMVGRFDRGAAGLAYQEEMKSTLFNKASFAFNELERRYTALSKSARGNTAEGVYLPYARVLVEEARKVLMLSESDKGFETKIRGKSPEVYGAERGKFRWKGREMSRAEFYDTLENTADPIERSQLAAAYSKATITAFKKKDGLFPSIDRLNGIAAKYGYRNYAEMAVQVYHSAGVDSLIKGMDELRATRGEELKRFIADLQGLNGGRPVNEWDVSYLTNLMIQREAGIKELPKLTTADAINIAKRFYADIGIDLDKPPFAGKITLDAKKREHKYPNAAAAGIGDGSEAWFTANFDPAGEITITDLDTVIHELAHIIHFIAGSRSAGGNMTMNPLTAQTYAFAEGFAIAMQYLVYEPAFMDRYLADLPQFSDPKIRGAIAKAKSAAALYQDMMVMVRARQEIELYRTEDEKGKYRSIDERMKAMTDIAERYLYVNAKADRLDFWSLPHPSYCDVYYSNYSLGRNAGNLAAKDILDAVRKELPLKDTAKGILDVFRQGPRLRTPDEVLDYVRGKRG